MYGRNPRAPQGVTALTLEELYRGRQITTHFIGTSEWTCTTTVMGVYPTYGRVVVRNQDGTSSTNLASDMGLQPGPHGWARNYTVAA